MNKQPVTTRYRMNGITVDVCRGEIPDRFRQKYYSPPTIFELPDAKVIDGEFEEWLSLYRISDKWFAHNLLEEAQCS